MQEKNGRYKNQSEQYEIYVVDSQETPHYFIAFCDVNCVHHKVEITEDVYFEFLKSFRAINNHRWNSWHHGTIVGLHENMLVSMSVPNLEDIVIRRELIETIAKILERFPAKQRRRFRLYYEFGFTYSEIARQEGCTIKAVKNTVMKAKEKIKVMLQQE